MKVPPRSAMEWATALPRISSSLVSEDTRMYRATKAMATLIKSTTTRMEVKILFFRLSKP